MKANHMSSSICAIILAAGSSTRMGKPKQLLLLNGRPLLEHVILGVAACEFSEIIAVVGHEAEQIQKAIPIKDPRFSWVVNPAYSSGQSSSLKSGMAHAGKHHDGIMVFLGDLPFILESTIQSIFLSGTKMLFESGESFIIQPNYCGVMGHPVFFGNIARELFMPLHGDKGAKAIMENIPCRKQFLVEDEGILFDIDTSEAYEKAKKFRYV